VLESRTTWTADKLLKGAGADTPPTEIATDTALITSGRFVLARLPDGTAGYFLKAAGAGVDPAFAALAAGDIASGRLVLARLPDGTSGYFLKAGGAGTDPAYALLVDADIPATIARDAEVDTKVSDHAALATGIHAVGTNFVAQAPAASHLVRTFTKGWTLNMLVKGAGADADPTEEEMNQSCRAEHSAAQSIPNNAWTTLSFSSEAWDTNNIHDNATNNSRLTCKVAGYYLVIGFCQWVSNSTGRRLIRIQKNGTTTMFQAEVTISAANIYAPMDITGFLYLAVNDYIELQVFQTSGAALNTYYEAGKIPNNFNMHRLVT